ncbi:MAG: DUF2341 domain-containing protein [Chitinispirillaceae bacterium]|nr:DUF2341 domain-containing protein [Chitinispirillaceae bacterium]
MIDAMKDILLVALFLAGVLLPRCSGRLAGAGSETTNGIVGSIRNPDDSPAPNTIVKLFPFDYDPVARGDLGSTGVDTTDDAGAFRFTQVDSGSYSILARNARTATSLLITDVAIGNGDTLTTVPPVNLTGTGSVEADFSGTGEAISGYLYIPGTDIFSPVGNDGPAVLDNVPSGSFSTVIHATADGEQRNLLRGEVTVMPGSTVTIPYPAWRYSRRIFLNTTPRGAGVMDDQYGFPVLIRLDEGTFDFTVAHSAGNDILFTKSDNTPLPCDIERWDGAARRAEIWVKTDTVFGNDSAQSITMYWGNPGAVREPQAGAVFDTAGGFGGVWHLGDAINDSIRDATGNRYDGGSPDTACPPITEGLIGNCRSFDASGNYITMPNTGAGRLNFPQNGTYTVSAWVTTDTLDGLSHVIVSKGNVQYFLWLTPIHLNTTPLWEFAGYRDGSGWDLSVQPASVRQWVLLTGVRDGSSQRLYVNGEPVDTLIDFPFTAARTTTSDLIIGRFNDRMASPNDNEGYCPFNGRIDEVRICGIARSAAWVRLCYMNQRAENKLVIFK